LRVERAAVVVRAEIRNDERRKLRARVEIGRARGGAAMHLVCVAEDLEQRIEAALGVQQCLIELCAYPTLLAEQRPRFADEIACLLRVAFDRADRVGPELLERLADRVELGEIIVAGLTGAPRDRSVAGIAVVRGQ